MAGDLKDVLSGLLFNVDPGCSREGAQMKLTIQKSRTLDFPRSEYPNSTSTMPRMTDSLPLYAYGRFSQLFLPFGPLRPSLHRVAGTHSMPPS
jgi:hypothetical protein